MTTPPPDGLRPTSYCGWCHPIPVTNTGPVAAIVHCSCWDRSTEPPTPLPCESTRCPSRYLDLEYGTDPFAVRFAEVR